MRNVRKTNRRRILRNDSCRALADVSSSIEVAEQIFRSVEENDRDTPVDSISMLSLLTGISHLSPSLCLREKGIFSTTLEKI